MVDEEQWEKLNAEVTKLVDYECKEQDYGLP